MTEELTFPTPPMTPTKMFRPLLSATLTEESLNSLRLPLVASPKIDGIRVICHPKLGPITRSCKPVRNRHIHKTLSHPDFSGLDGEIVCGPITAKDVFQRTTNGVMTIEGAPSFAYYVFDSISSPSFSYLSRHVLATAQTTRLGPRSNVHLLDWKPIETIDQILEAEIEYLSLGFEGIMLRSPECLYKYGRSTLKEQTLLKLKRFSDAEATIVGFEPLQSNQNPQTRDLLGLAQRSDHKAGKVEVQTLGRLIVLHDGRFAEFAIGSGFDSSTREHIWANQEAFLGKVVKFKYQEVGILNKPRFPIYLGIKGAE